jgi:putative oxidoreductase
VSALHLVLRVGLAALFVWAGAAKLGDPLAFTDEIANYRLLPQLAPLLGAALPMIEVVAGLVLVIGPTLWRAGAALLILGLLVAFTGAVSAAWLRGIDVACGCFGKGGGFVDSMTVLRDLAFVAWAAIVLARVLRSSDKMTG